MLGFALLWASSRRGQPTSPPLPFAADSVWNSPLPGNAALDGDSSTLVAGLSRQVASSGGWVNTTSYSVPIYTVGASQPRTPVRLDVYPGGDAAPLAQQFAAGVPIPSSAQPAQGTDAQLVVWQPSRDKLWELWRAAQVAGVWHARWGGVMDHVSRNPGYFYQPRDWGASATSLPLLGGLIRISELRSGHIDHALALAIPQARAGTFVFPAQRTDGSLNDPAAIPEGTRFRLPADLDIAALHLPHFDQMIASAAQRYGIVVRDQAGAVVFLAEDPVPYGSDPYGSPHGFFDGESPHDLLARFPWQRLQAVAARPNAYGQG